MNINLEIKADQIGDTVIDVFKSLSEDQKKEVASKIMEKWMKDPISIERDVIEQKVIDDLRNKEDYLKKQSDAEIRANYRFRDAMKNQRGTKEAMILSVMESVSSYFKSSVDEMIKNDEAIKNMLEVVKDEIRTNYPKFVHDAMIAFFAGHMQNIGQGITQALMQTDNNQNMMKNIANKLNIQQY